MDKNELCGWFTNLRDTLESAYLQHDEPWRQSGFSGPEERWIALRKPIADCIEKSGTFLDIGCANGYLLESITKWTAERKLSINPYGLDLSERLVELAKKRLTGYKNNMHVGNGWDWDPPTRFDYVRTELVYVPDHLQKLYIQRIIDEYLVTGGKLLAAGYTSSKYPEIKPDVDLKLVDWGFKVEKIVSGFWNGLELARIAVVKAK